MASRPVAFDEIRVTRSLFNKIWKISKNIFSNWNLCENFWYQWHFRYFLEILFAGHTGDNPFISKNFFLRLSTIIYPIEPESIYLADFFRIGVHKVKNCDVKNVKICWKSQKNPHYSINQWLIESILKIWPKIVKIWYPDFSRIFRIRFFPGIFSCRDLQGVKLFAIL